MADALKTEDAEAQARIREIRNRFDGADPATIDQILREARTHNGWSDRPVAEEMLRSVYELMKWGPTSFNQQPLRLVFVRSDAGKEMLAPALSTANHDKTMAAPAVAILAYDLAFYQHLPRVFPPADVKGLFEGNPERAAEHAFRNGTLQAAYFIIAARAHGLDCGPMSGFDRDKVDAAFFKGTDTRANFLCSLGYGDETKVSRRLPRFDFEEVARIV